MSIRQVTRKTNIFCGLCKKVKLYLVKSIIFITEFCLFYTLHMISRFFMKRLCERVASVDVRTKFFVSIFLKFKMFITCISKYREHMHPCSKTPLPSTSVSYLGCSALLHLFIPNSVSYLWTAPPCCIFSSPTPPSLLLGST